MKLKRGETVNVYVNGQEEVTREDMLLKVQGKGSAAGKELVEQYTKNQETLWLDKQGEVAARSRSSEVLSISIKPGNLEERKRELLNELKNGLESISKDDCGLEDVRRALKAQIEYAEFVDLAND